MKNKLLIGILTMTLFIFCYKTSICLEKNIWINDINEKEIKVSLVNIDIKEESLNIDKEYNAYAVITMNVQNNSKNNIELSNIDVYPYQNNEPIKYFVSTSSENIKGFIGNLNPKESKIIKMGITLNNTNDPIKLEFSNIEDINNSKTIEIINIK